MGAGKNKVRRKRRISKHVQDANERRKNKEEGEQETGTGNEQQSSNKTSSTSEKKSKKKDNRHIKDPSEAAAYLSSWKHRDAGSGWKFNKNTQSWLIRNMYETDKVPKATFTLLVDYLLGVKGITRTRLREEAARRALRYKEHEKKQSQDKKEDGGDEADVAEGSSNKAKDDDDTALDAVRWASLDDHDKRKEYKRARKILDAIKEDQEDSS